MRSKHWFKDFIAEVVEDRGNIGALAVAAFTVKVRVDPWNEQTTELPEESLECGTDGEDLTRRRRARWQKDKL